MNRTNDTQLTKSEEDKIFKQLQKSRIDLLLHYPFFGILSLKFELIQEYGIPTAGTDGKNFYYNPIFMKTLPQKQINFIFVHEIMHCALRHIWRQGTRNKEKFNMAADYAIHSILYDEQKNNSIEMPSHALYNSDYNGMTAEQIYDTLPDKPNQNGGGSGTQTLDDHSQWNKSNGNNGNEDGYSNVENDWQNSLVSAAQAVNQSGGKDAGSIPGFFKRYIDELTNPVKDWRVLLREFIEPEPSDYTFVRPDYRIDYDEFGCFLPSFNEETEVLNKIVFWIDTSGSISNTELNKIYSEVAGAIQQFDVFNGYLGFFDSNAYEPQVFSDINSLKEIKPVGGGGTNFYAPFEYLNNSKDFNNNVKCVIMLTDGYCNFPPEDIIDVPVIWLITSKDIKAPWGQSIYLPLESVEDYRRVS